MSNLVGAVVVEEEIQAATLSEVRCGDGTRSSIICDAVAAPGLDVSKNKDLLPVAGCIMLELELSIYNERYLPFSRYPWTVTSAQNGSAKAIVSKVGVMSSILRVFIGARRTTVDGS
jgi:hypothetical protein